MLPNQKGSPRWAQKDLKRDRCMGGFGSKRMDHQNSPHEVGIDLCFRSFLDFVLFLGFLMVFGVPGIFEPLSINLYNIPLESSGHWSILWGNSNEIVKKSSSQSNSSRPEASIKGRLIDFVLVLNRICFFVETRG